MSDRARVKANVRPSAGWGLGLLLLVALGSGRAVADPGPLPGTPVGRASETLAAREAILSNQAAMARITARWRARELYRFLRAGGDLGGDRALPESDRARALVAGARALARERREERLLVAERDQTRAEQAALPDGGGARAAGVAAAAPRASGPAPRLVSPLAGARRSRFGATRDPATGAWYFRAGVRLDGRAGDPVRAVGAGVVRRVVARSAQGPALLIDHGGGWVSVLANLDLNAKPDLLPGTRVAAGQLVGRVGSLPGGLVCELWRAGAPVDPAAFIDMGF